MTSKSDIEDKENHFENEENHQIFCKYWKTKESPKALMLIIHGFGEHCNRYEPLAEMLTSLGFLVFSQDHVGHGKSGGYRCDITDYNIYVRDLYSHIQKMKDQHPDLALYVFGHSMGGALAILLATKYPELFQAVVLSSPMILKNEAFKSQIKVTIGRYLSPYLPHLPVADLDASLISRNVKEVEKYTSDPLVNHHRVMLRMGYQLYEMSEKVTSLVSEVTSPFLVLHGDQDRLCEIAGSKLLYETAKNSDKNLEVYKDCYHELIHEIDDIPAKFLNDIKSWLEKRMP